MLFFQYTTKNCYAMLSIHVCSLCIILAHAPMNGVNQLVNTLPPRSSLQKSTGVTSQLCSKPSLKCTFQTKNFQATGGCFKCNMYRIMALGWLRYYYKQIRKKKVRKSNVL